MIINFFFYIIVQTDWLNLCQENLFKNVRNMTERFMEQISKLSFVCLNVSGHTLNINRGTYLVSRFILNYCIVLSDYYNYQSYER